MAVGLVCSKTVRQQNEMVREGVLGEYFSVLIFFLLGEQHFKIGLCGGGGGYEILSTLQQLGDKVKNGD